MEESFTYDHQRTFMQGYANGTGRTKRYVGNCEIINASVDNTSVSKIITYLSGPTGVFAVVGQLGNEESIHYIQKDNLGSWTTITDAEGNVEQELSFDAWGNRRNPETWQSSNQLPVPLFDRGFTGHEHLYAFGLINMNGRVYDPQMSSFLSVDAYVQSPENSQSFNRYAYCLNNPLKYTDPSGWVMVGGMTPSNPFHENWGVNFAAKAYTPRDFGLLQLPENDESSLWMEGNEMEGGGGGGDDGKKKGGDKSKQAKDAYNYSNGVATLIGGAAKPFGKESSFFKNLGISCQAISILGMAINEADNWRKYKAEEISLYSFFARSVNLGGEYALSFIPYGIGPTLSITVAAIDIGGGFENNIYNEEWVKGVLDGIKEFTIPKDPVYEQSTILYYRHGW